MDLLNKLLKVCTGCRLEKSVSCFYKNKARYDGLNNYCKDCDSKRIKSMRLKNPKVFRNSSNKSYKVNRISRIKHQKEYARLNPDKRLALTQNRRSAKLQRTPPWAKEMMKSYMKLMAKLSSSMTKQTGIRQSIDHIVPLRGKLVSGLNVPWNLQIIPLTENSSKINKFEPSVLNLK